MYSLQMKLIDSSVVAVFVIAGVAAAALVCSTWVYLKPRMKMELLLKRVHNKRGKRTKVNFSHLLRRLSKQFSGKDLISLLNISFDLCIKYFFFCSRIHPQTFNPVLACVLSHFCWPPSPPLCLFPILALVFLAFFWFVWCKF